MTWREIEEGAYTHRPDQLKGRDDHAGMVLFYFFLAKSTTTIHVRGAYLVLCAICPHRKSL
jgi:hypothetical protein